MLSVPWGQAVLFLVLAAVVGVLAALWPGVRAARTPPLAAIVGPDRRRQPGSQPAREPDPAIPGPSWRCERLAPYWWRS